MDKKVSAIPQPKTYGPLGNLPLIDKDKPTLSLYQDSGRVWSHFSNSNFK